MTLKDRKTACDADNKGQFKGLDVVYRLEAVFLLKLTKKEKKKTALAFTQMDKTWRGLTRQWFMIRRWTIQGCCQDREREMIQMLLPFRIALLFFCSPSSNSQICSFLTSLSFLSISKSAALIDRYCSALCREVNKPHEESGILKWAINAALLGKGRSVSREAKGDRLLSGQDWGGHRNDSPGNQFRPCLLQTTGGPGENEKKGQDFPGGTLIPPPPLSFFPSCIFFFPSLFPCRNHLHSGARRPQKRHLQSIMINSLHLSPFVFLPVKNHSGCMSKATAAASPWSALRVTVTRELKLVRGKKTQKTEHWRRWQRFGDSGWLCRFWKFELFKDKDGFKFKDASVFI